MHHNSICRQLAFVWVALASTASAGAIEPWPELDQDASNGASENEESSVLLRAIEELELQDAWRWLEDRRDGVSRNVTIVGRNLDDWLAGEAVGDRANESYLRVRLNQRIGRFDTYYSKANIGGRIDLPRAAERWKLIFETETTEQNSLTDQRLNNVSSSDFTGAFRYEHPEWNGWRFNHDVGVKSSIPLDPFYRFRIRYGADINEDWYFGLSNRVFYYHHDGLGQDSRMFFTRTITDAVNFRIESEIKYRHDERLTEFAQSFAIHQELGPQATMTYETGLIASNRPVTEVNNYYAQMVYRKAIYEDWLIMEVVPQLLFESRYNWKADPRVQLNLEIYFFDL
ncbi:MAG: hypothetical protein Q7L19_08330 [Pseudohongiella sp.]|nr:hypothetical protein [Pseudohongiella sp.]